MSVRFLSMKFVLLGLIKLGFVKFFKQGTLQKSGREVLREEMFENKQYFPYNYATH